LKEAGGKGWSEVYKVWVYVAPWNDALMPELVRNLKRYCPDHAPALTGFGVQQLAIPGMRVEIEVKAHVKEG
jgi:enamine deaminase RidA (YjgF/YER057c/UK114 family)